VDDAFTAYRWAQIHCEELGIDFNRIAVGGDSAGGNLAAAVCVMAKNYGAALPCAQLLLYPAVGAPYETASVKEFTDTPMCNSRDMEKYGLLYNPHKAQLPPEERVYASPGEAESVAGMPPAYVETAEFDCLRDEGILYAKRLEEEGIYVILNETKGTIHGYDFISKSPIVLKSLQHRISFLRRIFRENR